VVQIIRLVPGSEDGSRPDFSRSHRNKGISAQKGAARVLTIMIYITSVLLVIELLLTFLYILVSFFRRLLPPFFERMGIIIVACTAAAVYSLGTILFISTHGLNIMGEKAPLSNLPPSPVKAG